MTEWRLATGLLFVCLSWNAGLCPSPAVADQKPARAEQLKAIQADYQAARDEVLNAIRAGKVKSREDGGYQELADLQNRFAKRTREFIDAEPKDESALDAILFSIRQLVADANDQSLYQQILGHHLTNPKLAEVVDRHYATDEFLRAVAEKSPHVEIRGKASLVQAKRLARANHPQEAEAICIRISNDQALDQLHRGAQDLLFEIRHLSVGKVIPEIDGLDLDDKPMKLSEYRGKAVMLVFWATWCGPCMKMVPHERELARRFAGKPFAIVGINGDLGQEERAKKAVQTEQITWRSFRNYLLKEKREIASRWNVVEWPTVFLIDHEGVVRQVYRGMPAEKELDAAVEKLVIAAQAHSKVGEMK
jgi:thiol-disulfide isomerase/thioredoxin